MTSLLDRLWKLNKELRPRWSLDWNAPVHVLASDGSGEHQAKARDVKTAEAIVECRNSLPAVLNLIEAARATEEFLDNHLRRGEPLEREMLYAHRDSLRNVLAVFVAPGGDLSTMSGQEAEPQAGSGGEQT